jgi:hypothetical protein
VFELANFVGGLPTDLIKKFEQLEIDTNKMLSDMVKAGADVVRNNVNGKMPRELKKVVDSGAKVSKVYKTPTDDGINQQVVISGYFVNRWKQVTPAPLVANLFEYGRSGASYPKKSFFRASFNQTQIEQAMLKEQEKYIKGD